MRLRKRILSSVLILLLGGSLLCGCGMSREELEDAYSLYDTVSKQEVALETDLSFFASDLCVGGTKNTEDDSIITSYADTAAVFLLNANEISYAQNIYEKCYPASTTKILTAYVALKYGSLDDVLTVSESALSSLDAASSVCGLEIGDQLTLRDALYGLMLVSGNDAANVIAEYISGTTDDFAQLMNEEAAALGATQSHFVNAHGLPDSNHYTTAYDMYLIFRAALQNDLFTSIISTTSYDTSYTAADGTSVEKTWTNTNGYLSGNYDAPDNIIVVGGKTGTTSAAGYCLVLYSKNTDGEEIISVVFHGNSRSELYTMMNQILMNFS